MTPPEIQDPPFMMPLAKVPFLPQNMCEITGCSSPTWYRWAAFANQKHTGNLGCVIHKALTWHWLSYWKRILMNDDHKVFSHMLHLTQMGCSPFSQRKGLVNTDSYLEHLPWPVTEAASSVLTLNFWSRSDFQHHGQVWWSIRFTNCFTITKLFASAVLFIYQDENPVKLVLMLFPFWRQEHGLWELKELVHCLTGGQCPAWKQVLQCVVSLSIKPHSLFLIPQVSLLPETVSVIP